VTLRLKIHHHNAPRIVPQKPKEKPKKKRRRA
jgi:hypothetical protein